MTFTYPFPRPAVTCDAVLFTIQGDDLSVLLVKRKNEPFAGSWALPGGSVDKNEPLSKAVLRELEEETGLKGIRFEQLGAYGDPGRDPRGHTVTIAWVAFLHAAKKLRPGDDAIEAAWLPLRTLSFSASSTPTSRPARRPRRGQRHVLAFDHARIIRHAYARLCRHLDNPARDAALSVVPTRFTLAELQRVYEVVLGRTYKPAAFKKQVVMTHVAVPASAEPPPKPATQLYRWNR